MMGFTFQNSPRPRYRYGYISRTQNFNEFELHLRAILSLPILKLPWKAALTYTSIRKYIKPTYTD
jgi:formate-dependent phosphoribosylglycinamide formyltransferase (GAR transformylase)